MSSFHLTKKQTLIVMCAAVVLAIGALVATGLIYAVYAQRSDHRIVRTLASSFPAARIGSYAVTYGDFLRSRDTLQIYMKSDAAQQSGFAQPITPDVEKSALDRLIRQEVFEELSGQKNIKISDDEVRAAFSTLILATSSTIPDVAQYLKDTFRWTEEDFRRYVMRPAILEERLAATFTSSTAEQPAAMEAYLRERLAKPDVKIYLKFGSQE